MEMRKFIYWAAFLACHIAGFAMLSFVNIHNNIAPLFYAAILLLPSGLIMLFFSNLPTVLMVCAIVFVNFCAWYVFYRWGGAEFLRQRNHG